MKDRLIFDTTDANTIADSDSIGAFLRSSDGTLITHTNDATNSKDRLDVLGVLADEAGNAVGVTSNALDVNITNSLGIDVDLDHTEDSVRLGDGVDFFTSTTVGADIGLDVNLINASIAVTATDLDIRDLTAASDSVQSNLFDGAGTALTSTLVSGDQALDVNVSNEISVNDAALANTAIANGATSLTTGGTAESAVASALTDRKYLWLYNNDNRVMYIGTGSVSDSNGFPVSPSSRVEMRAGASIDVNFVSAKTSHDLRYLELS